MSFTAFHTGTLSESSPKGADELSEIGSDAFENKDVKRYRSPMLIDKVSTGLCIIKIEYILTRCQNICIIHLDTKSEYK